MSEMRGLISIWFFIGIMLVFCGALVLGSGIYQYVVPPEHPLVLAELHPGIWWGAVLLALGLFYTLYFRPRRKA
jgi:hypothetical protein